VARSCECSAHDAGTCGIHIHTSKDAWDGYQLVRLFALLYDTNNYNDILTITQRSEGNLRRWASLDVADIGKYKNDIVKKRSPFRSRYAALNMTGNTLEFRIFNSSLRLDRVRKNMEFVHALYCYTGEVMRVSWKGLLRWVERHKKAVPHLYDFMTEKNIIARKRARAAA
jgi:hypothetical protein